MPDPTTVPEPPNTPDDPTALAASVQKKLATGSLSAFIAELQAEGDEVQVKQGDDAESP